MAANQLTLLVCAVRAFCSTMVPDRASRGGPDLAVTDHLSGNTADDRTFDAALRFRGSRERKQRGDDGSANKQLLHGLIPPFEHG
jgi:hypothetical protein